MQTNIHTRFSGQPAIDEADSILRSCVHCGFCNATCPTYLELGDERDGPRGRIYLVKQLLEQGTASEKTRLHLDRCLTCRSCETTCPSGVQYGKLVDIGRDIVEQTVPRSTGERLVRRLLRLLVPWPRRFAPLIRVGQWLRPLMPRVLRSKVPPRQTAGERPGTEHTRKLVLLGGCVQSVATPRSNAAAARVLDKLGITAVEPPQAGCCGALSYHLSEHDEARGFIRRNLDAWRSQIEAGAEAIVSCSSGCGAMLKDYGYVMRDDPEYAALAQTVSELTRDLSEVLVNEDLGPLAVDATEKTAIHYPCTLSHALGAAPALRSVLERAGIELARTGEDHLCCGSAGTYSILQPELSSRLLRRKLAALTADGPDRIVTANIGCQLHIGGQAPVPVGHWIELLDR